MIRFLTAMALVLAWGGAAVAQTPDPTSFPNLAVGCHVAQFTGVRVSCTLPAAGAAHANQAAGLPAGDCSADDSLGVQTFLNQHAYADIEAPIGCYRIVSADLVLPTGVNIRGSGNALLWTRRYGWQNTTTFMFDGSHSFVHFMADAIHNIAIVRDGAQTACPAGARFTATIDDGAGNAGTVLTVTAVTSGTIHLTDLLGGPGIPSPGITVDSNGTGTGGVGTYNLNQPLLLGSQTMTTGPVPPGAMCGDPTDGQIQYMQAGWGSDESTGIHVASGTPLQLLGQRINSGGFAIDRVFIGGFFKPFDLEAGIGTVRDLFVDGFNGIYLGPSGANTLLENVQTNRWLCSASANCLGGKSEFRGGIAFYFDQAAIHLHDSFSHNFRQGLVIANVNGGFWHNVAAEFQDYDPIHTGTVGARIFGSTGGRIGGEHTSFLSFVQPYQFEASDIGPLPNAFTWDMPQFVQPSTLIDENDAQVLNPAVMSYVYLGGPTGYSNTMTFAGTPAVGDAMTTAINVTVPAMTSAPTPFGPVTAATNATTDPALRSGYTLKFAAIPVGAVPGMKVTDTTQPAAYPPETIIVEATATTLTTSALPTVIVGSGDTISVSLANDTLVFAATVDGARTPPGVVPGATIVDNTTSGRIPAGTKVLSKTLYSVRMDNAVTGGGVLAADSLSFLNSRSFTWTATGQDIAYNPNSPFRLAQMSRELGYLVNIDPTMATLRCHAESVRKPNSLNIFCPAADTVAVTVSTTGGITSQFNYDTQTSAGTAAGLTTLNFTGPIDVGISKGDVVIDVTTPSAITAGTTVASVTTTSVTLNTPVAGPGVGSGDHMQFPGAPEGGAAAKLYNGRISNNKRSIPVFLQDGGASSNVTVDGLFADQGFWDRWVMGATLSSNLFFENVHFSLAPFITGAGCALVEGTDEKGLVTETTASTGCTVTFRSDYPWQPVGEVSGPGIVSVTTDPAGSSMSWVTTAPAATSNFRYRSDFR